MPAPIQLMFDLGLNDLNPIEVGESENFPDRHVFPKSFNAVIIHHIRRGWGTLHIKGQDYRLGPGQGFIIMPGEEHTLHYKSDHDDPWEYGWISFTGKLAHRFSALPPVFDLPAGSFPHMYDLRNASDNLGYLLASDLFTLYAKLLNPKYRQCDHIQLIIEHIEKNYMQKLTVEDFAQRFNMDRRYLSQQFKSSTGTTIRAYLTKTRMAQAAKLLAQGSNTKDVAMSCGFSNTANFHKQFASFYGKTPSQWKKDHRN